MARPAVERAFQWATFALALLVPALAVAFRARSVPALLAGLFGFAVTTFLYRAWAAPVAGALHVSGERVTFTRRGRPSVTLQRDAIRDGAVAPRDGSSAVELRLADGRVVTLETEGLSRTEAVLSTLGVDASRHRSELALVRGDEQRQSALTWLVCLSAIFTVFLGGSPSPQLQGLATLGLALIALPTWTFLSATRSAGTATVGLDGIELRGGRDPRFVPLEDVVAVHDAPRGVELEHADGRRELLVRRKGLTMERTKALMLTVLEALRARERRTATRSVPSLLERGERSVAEWCAAIRKRARGGDGYRSAAHAQDELAEILEDPDASVERRLGAAMALAEAGSPEMTQRLRIAAETSASPRVRVALTGIAETKPDELAIERALEEEEEEEPEAGTTATQG